MTPIISRPYFPANERGVAVKKTSEFLLALFLLLGPAFLIPQDFAQEWHLDVPYVPTKPEVVAKMLEMAAVGKNDVLFDLGCGDGRIVITAAKLFSTRGVGIDINPERIKECRENAGKENVTHLVKFLEQDLFQTDFHEATVVTLYLLSSVNLRLRPILFEQLKPGTRVVSHDFSMDTWKPDNSAVVATDGMTHDVYFWVIPANASGTWEWTWPEGSGKLPCRLELDQHFQVLTGRITAGGRELALNDLNITGDRLKFSVGREEGGKTRTTFFEGRVARNTVEGTMAVQGEGKQGRSPWKAERRPATMKRIATDNGKGF
jgi:SAM-dependent methyltransferase